MGHKIAFLGSLWSVGYKRWIKSGRYKQRGFGHPVARYGIPAVGIAGVLFHGLSVSLATMLDLLM